MVVIFLQSLVYVIGLFAVIFLNPSEATTSEDMLCPDSDNPLNIELRVPVEILVNGTWVYYVPIAMDFLDPRDVACDKNYNYVTPEMFKEAVNCYLNAPNTITCEVDRKCLNQRKETLSRLRKVVMKTLDEVVLKLKGLKLFDYYLDAKRLIFGTEPLAKLNGLEIFRKSTTGPFNILNGFKISNRSYMPSLEVFERFFVKPIEMYIALNEAAEPTGQLGKDNSECVRVSRGPQVTEREFELCYQYLLETLKDNSKQADSKLMALLEESLKFIASDLADGTKPFSGLRIPFMGHCIGGNDVDPTAPYTDLLDAIRSIK